MPPVCWHMVTARESSQRVKDKGLDTEVALYLLGATAPDVRIITGRPREETHYLPLDADHGESGIQHLFEAHPELAGVVGRPRAFLGGYLTHLAVDELWITEVFRPFFGRDSEHNGSLEANIMDRTLQFYMDYQERLDRDKLNHFYEHIFGAQLGADVPLVDLPDLIRWREWVQSLLKNEPSWDGFKAFLQRRLKIEFSEDEERLKQLAMQVPDILDNTLRYVSAARVAAFKEEAISRQTAVLRNYLG